MSRRIRENSEQHRHPGELGQCPSGHCGHVPLSHTGQPFPIARKDSPSSTAPRGEDHPGPTRCSSDDLTSKPQGFQHQGSSSCPHFWQLPRPCTPASLNHPLPSESDSLAGHGSLPQLSAASSSLPSCHSLHLPCTQTMPSPTFTSSPYPPDTHTG